MEKVLMPKRDKETRINDFKEVNLGYDKDLAIKEASRCLNCQNPTCVKGCPINIKINEFIQAIKNDNMALAYDIILSSSSLPGICGRVCPQENQCEKYCIKGYKGEAIMIGALERYVADYALKNNLKLNNKKAKINKKVAIVGSGPAGLLCAYELFKNGVDVTVYEALHKAGGVLTYGIPEFRLPKEIVKKEIDNLSEAGVYFIFDTVVGKSITLDDLKKEYDAIFIGSGAGLPKFLGIEGENANQVFSANEILTRINLMKAHDEEFDTPLLLGENVLVIGGGNVAVDAARSIKRLGKNVSLVYRRSEKEMNARREEIINLLEENISIHYLTNPKKIVTDDNNNVIGLEVEDMILLDSLKDGKREIKSKNEEPYIIKCDSVVIAIGNKVNNIILKDSIIKHDQDNLIITEDTKTSDDVIYAGGDATTGSATVILAMSAGKKAAQEILTSFNC